MPTVRATCWPQFPCFCTSRLGVVVFLWDCYQSSSLLAVEMIHFCTGIVTTGTKVVWSSKRVLLPSSVCLLFFLGLETVVLNWQYMKNCSPYHSKSHQMMSCQLMTKGTTHCQCQYPHYFSITCKSFKFDSKGLFENWKDMMLVLTDWCESVNFRWTNYFARVKRAFFWCHRQHGRVA